MAHIYKLAGEKPRKKGANGEISDTARQPARPHYIAEWAAISKLRKIDIATRIDTDRSLVSRWFSGTSPGVESQEKLAALFGIRPADLFCHPDDVWFSLFLRGRHPDEVERIKATLVAGFPPPRST